jgi:hypothetical protein
MKALSGLSGAMFQGDFSFHPSKRPLSDSHLEQTEAVAA